MRDLFKLKKAANLLTVADYLEEARQCISGGGAGSAVHIKLAIEHLAEAVDMIAHKRSSAERPPGIAARDGNVALASGDLNVGLPDWASAAMIDKEAEKEQLRRDREAMAMKSHPGFVVECVACGSKEVVVESSLGYSHESGAWGSVDLKCMQCNHSVEIFES